MKKLFYRFILICFLTFSLGLSANSYAIEVIEITQQTHPDIYEDVLERLNRLYKISEETDHVDTKNGEFSRIKGKVILQVTIDGRPYGKYSSGLKKDGDIKGFLFVDSANFETTLEEEYARIMQENNFPHEEINFYAVVDRTSPDSVINKIKNIAEKQIAKSYGNVISNEPFAKDMSLFSEYADALAKHYREVKNYFQPKNRTSHGLEKWKNSVESLQFIDKDDYENRVSNKIRDNYSTITESDQMVSQTVRNTNDSTTPLVGLPTEDINNLTAVKNLLMSFLSLSGTHCEDAFIGSFIRDIEMNNFEIDSFGDEINIKMYGSTDPCFQCQLKLQWLSNVLSEKLSNKPVTITYYSDNEHSCRLLICNPVLSDDIETDDFVEDNFEQSYSTRALDLQGHRNNIKAFVFTSGGNYDNIITINSSIHNNLA